MSEPFRWQALLQRATEPLFLLDRQRRIRFVNRAWEELTGLSATEARGLVCRRRREVEPGSPEGVAHALTPPAEVRAGQAGRARRLIAGSPGRWWDVEFFPLRDGPGTYAVLGKIVPATGMAPWGAAPLPEKLGVLREEAARRYTFDSLAGGLPAQQRIVEQVRLASQTRATVLIVGEAGVGKEWAARVIHHQGTDRDRPFAALDCARLPPAALASALFGGGGLARRPGTLYLKAIAALPRDLQTRLGNVLADPDPSGPRVLASLSVDPAAEVQTGRLLDDLQAALSTLVLTLPPLRERRTDVPMLVDRLLEQVRTEDDPGRRHGTGLAADALEIVCEYRWPGNLRELAAVLTTACHHAKADAIAASDLPAYVRQAVRLDQEAGRAPERPLPLVDLMQQVERRLIILALQMAKGNKSRAAELLALSRGSLLNRLERLGIGNS